MLSCPENEILQLFILGRLAQEQEEQIEKHLEGCESCSKRLAELETKRKAAIFRDIQAAHANDSASVTTGNVQTISPVIPESIGHYKVIEILGSGGMGTVYLAENPHLDRKVAVKVVKASRSLHQSSLDRFSREMKAVGKLRHPNIVQALDGGVIDDQPYLVMEYLEGNDLSRYVKEHGPLSLKQACDIIREVANALDYAHRLGYIHRDIKPSNIWLTPDGTAKILDFGLVGLLETENNNTSPVVPQQGTVEGVILGSPDYISPEQIVDPKKADNRSDIYSLGCTFFYLLTGQPPFGKDTHPNIHSKIEAHVSESFPSLRQIRKDIPNNIELLLLSMTAKRPQDRPQAINEITRKLNSIKEPFSLLRMLVLFVAGLIFATAIIVVMVWNNYQPIPQQISNKAIESEQVIQKTTYFEDEIDETLKPVELDTIYSDSSSYSEDVSYDDDPIAYCDGLPPIEVGELELELRRITGSDASLDTLLEEYYKQPGFYHGKWQKKFPITLVQTDRAYQSTAIKGADAILKADYEANGRKVFGSWGLEQILSESKGGKGRAFFVRDGTDIIDVQNEGFIRIWHVDGTQGVRFPTGATVSAIAKTTDDRLLYFATDRDRTEDLLVSPHDNRAFAQDSKQNSIRRLDSRTGEVFFTYYVRQLMFGYEKCRVYSLTFSLDGTRLFAGGTGGVIWKVSPNGSTKLIQPYSYGTIFHSTFSPDGTELFFSDDRKRLYRLRAEKYNQIPYPIELESPLEFENNITDLRLSHDLERLIVVYGTNKVMFIELGDASGNDSGVGKPLLLHAKRTLITFDQYPQRLYCCASSPDGAHFAVGGEGVIHFFNGGHGYWRTLQGQIDYSQPSGCSIAITPILLDDPTETVISLDFSPDGTRLIAKLLKSGDVHVWKYLQMSPMLKNVPIPKQIDPKPVTDADRKRAYDNLIERRKAGEVPQIFTSRNAN